MGERTRFSRALEVLEQWQQAFSVSDVDRIVALYAEDATFFGSGSKRVIDTTEGIRSYFETVLLDSKPCSSQLSERSVLAASEDIVVIAGLDRASGVRDGVPFGNSGRVTFVVAQRGDAWKIVHFHRSRLPD